MAKQKARLKDIAQKTGYGTNTVSLALRGSTRISKAAREKIAKAAEELDYVPNHIAKSLVSRRSHTVGLILHELSNPILTNAAEKIQRTLAARGYGVLFASSNGSFEEELHAIEMFRARMVDGLLIYPVRHMKLEHLRRLRERNFPVVLLIGMEGSGIDAVGIDEYAGAFEATRHLINEGHSRIGALVPAEYQTNPKYAGYRDALRSVGLDGDSGPLASFPDHSIRGGIEAMDRLMAQPDRPSAVFACSDLLALGALRWAKINGVDVPRRLAIAGFDDDEAAQYAVTPISTINNDVDELAHRSVARLMDLIDAGQLLPPPRAELLQGRLIIRESTRAAGSASASSASAARRNPRRRPLARSKEISLFDGKTLRGWQAVPRIPAPRWPGEPLPVLDLATAERIRGHTGRWTVEDGAICGRQDPPGSGLGAYLLTDETFGDFELSFEARPDWPADTGIILRATELGSQGYQVLLDHRKSGNIGGFYGNGIGRFHAINFNVDVARDRGRPTGLRLEDPAKSIEPITDAKRALLTRAATGEQFLAAWKWDDWNAFRITVRGELPTITTEINGTLIAEIDTGRLPAEVFDAEGTLALLGRRGHIGFEVHDNDPGMGAERWAPKAACRWRNIRLRPL
jgi:DNA-binding LacI/PurR family transcriptional regulator